MRFNYYIKKGIKYCFNSDARFIHSITKGNYHSELSDKEYLSRLWKGLRGYELDWDNLQTFTEKMQWLKIYDRNPLYAKMVDKAEAKEYVAEIIGKQYVIPTYGCWNSYDEIDFDNLPDEFVLKTTHDSGGVFIVKDKKSIIHDDLRKVITARLKDDYWRHGRETVYEKVPHRIIAEKMMGNGNTAITDYKVMCIEGKPVMIELLQGRRTGHLTQDIYDINWNLTEYGQTNEVRSGKTVPAPQNFSLMLKLSEKLSEGRHVLRVDWYEVGGQLFFGELTFFDGGGMAPYTPESFEKELGERIKL